MLDFKKFDPNALIVTMRDGKKLYAFNLSAEGRELYNRGLTNTVSLRARKQTGWELVNFDMIPEGERKLPEKKTGYIIKPKFSFYYGDIFTRNRWVHVVYPH